MRIIIEIDEALTPPQVSIVKGGAALKARSASLAMRAADSAALTAAEDAGPAPGYEEQHARAASTLEAEAAPPEPSSAGAAPK